MSIAKKLIYIINHTQLFGSMKILSMYEQKNSHIADNTLIVYSTSTIHAEKIYNRKITFTNGWYG